jgi:hypothetical protein
VWLSQLVQWRLRSAHHIVAGLAASSFWTGFSAKQLSVELELLKSTLGQELWSPGASRSCERNPQNYSQVGPRSGEDQNEFHVAEPGRGVCLSPHHTQPLGWRPLEVIILAEGKLPFSWIIQFSCLYGQCIWATNKCVSFFLQGSVLSCIDNNKKIAHDITAGLKPSEWFQSLCVSPSNTLATHSFLRLPFSFYFSGFSTWFQLLILLSTHPFFLMKSI